MENQLAQILELILAGIQKAGTFTTEQLPDIAQQYVVYGRAIETVTITLALLVTVFSLWAAKWGYIKGEETHEEVFAYVILMCWGVAGLGALVFCCTLDDFFQVWFAPKVYLLKEFVELVGRVK